MPFGGFGHLDNGKTRQAAGKLIATSSLWRLLRTGRRPQRRSPSRQSDLREAGPAAKRKPSWDNPGHGDCNR